jgi:hypothetical protein
MIGIMDINEEAAKFRHDLLLLPEFCEYFPPELNGKIEELYKGFIKQYHPELEPGLYVVEEPLVLVEPDDPDWSPMP